MAASIAGRGGRRDRRRRRGRRRPRRGCRSGCPAPSRSMRPAGGSRCPRCAAARSAALLSQRVWWSCAQSATGRPGAHRVEQRRDRAARRAASKDQPWPRSQPSASPAAVSSPWRRAIAAATPARSRPVRSGCSAARAASVRCRWASVSEGSHDDGVGEAPSPRPSRSSGRTRRRQAPRPGRGRPPMAMASTQPKPEAASERGDPPRDDEAPPGAPSARRSWAAEQLREPDAVEAGAQAQGQRPRAPSGR